MSRRLKVDTVEKGRLEIFVISESKAGVWEPDWELLHSTLFGPLIPRIQRAAFNHVLHGFSAPFVKALGLPPEGALQKVPSQLCGKQVGCPLYDKRRCYMSSRKLPWCYEPAGFDSLNVTARRKASDLIFLWKEGVHVVVVYDDE